MAADGPRPTNRMSPDGKAPLRKTSLRDDLSRTGNSPRAQPRNLAASVRQRLTQIARDNGEDFHLVLTRYGLERLLYRLTRSPHAETFVLKGACLFQLWSDQPHRPTRDLDLLGRGEGTIEHFETIFRQVCEQPVEADGLEFLSDRVRGMSIKDEDQYQGIRLRVDARLANARLPLQVDVGFGDAITPGPIEIEYPTLLDFPSPSLRAYPRETVIAEKFQAMVVLGMANSRMKDFFDLWTLAREYAFDGATLRAALQATFARRQTTPPTSPPLALTSVFALDKPKQTQWRAFLRKGKLANELTALPDVIGLLEPFLMPPTQAISAGRPFSDQWLPGGPWSG
jgi:predicted nucleotidyltransferase component of viral defense system